MYYNPKRFSIHFRAYAFIKLRMGYHINLKRAALLAIMAALINLLIRGCYYASRTERGASVPEPEPSHPALFISVYNDKEDKVIKTDLEDYLIGVVAAEMPVSFEPEALKAQAVAARTFTVRRVASLGGSPCGRQGAGICTDSACCQAWRSREALASNWGAMNEEYLDKVSAAVNNTRGKIITYGGEPIEALYHSTSGGMTEDSAHVFAQSLPYLVAVESPGEDSGSRFESTVTISRGDFVKKINRSWSKAGLKSSSLEKQVKIVSRYDSGRVEAIRLGGAMATGKELRKALGLDSANFSLKFTENSVLITTRGFGHGVGMSQLGANAMAKSGSDYLKILTHYYTGTEVVSITYPAG